MESLNLIRSRVSVSSSLLIERSFIWRVGIRRQPVREDWGFRMPLAEPGVRLSIRTGLSLDVYA
jgi:hypothetical protein